MVLCVLYGLRDNSFQSVYFFPNLKNYSLSYHIICFGFGYQTILHDIKLSESLVISVDVDQWALLVPMQIAVLSVVTAYLWKATMASLLKIQLYD